MNNAVGEYWAWCQQTFILILYNCFLHCASIETVAVCVMKAGDNFRLLLFIGHQSLTHVHMFM